MPVPQRLPFAWQRVMGTDESPCWPRSIIHVLTCAVALVSVSLSEKQEWRQGVTVSLAECGNGALGVVYDQVEGSGWGGAGWGGHLTSEQAPKQGGVRKSSLKGHMMLTPISLETR